MYFKIKVFAQRNNEKGFVNYIPRNSSVVSLWDKQLEINEFGDTSWFSPNQKAIRLFSCNPEHFYTLFDVNVQDGQMYEYNPENNKWTLIYCYRQKKDHTRQ